FDQVFSDNLPPLRVKVSSAAQRQMPPLDTVRQVVEALRTALPQVHINPVPGYERVVLTTDMWQAASYGVDPQALSSRIESVCRSRQLGEAAGADAYVPRVLAHPQPDSVQSALAYTYVSGAQHQQIPVASVVTPSRQVHYKCVTAGTQGAYHSIARPTHGPGADPPAVKEALPLHSGVLES